jgi:probable aminopeptidase NPEPL1
MLRLLGAVSSGITLASRMVDAPTNYMHTGICIQEALRLTADLRTEGVENLSSTVISGEELKEAGFGLLWGVGKAAVNLPALVVLSHTPDDGSSNSGEGGGLALCGKGIVYDSGGLSIKMKTFMPGMKRDMGGAATVLASFAAVVRMGGLPANRPLHCILCLAENSVGPASTRPDDVHTGFSGKTVEVVNTDAEGRLVLGDGVAYAASVLNASTIIDAATLTGAQGIATGKRHAAVYCSTERGETMAVTAGRFSGDLTHPLPYAPEFFRHEFRSAVADMTNNVKDRGNAQSSCAAQFIGNHLPEGWLDAEAKIAELVVGGEEVKDGCCGGGGGNNNMSEDDSGKTWIHIDMASPCYDKSSERATGYGVALIATLCGVVPGWDHGVA